VDVELLDGALDDAFDDVVEVEALHEATDGARVQVKNARGVALATNGAADSAGCEAEDVTGVALLALDDVANDVVGVEALGEAANEARAKVEGLVGLLRVADNTANGARGQAENITRLTLDNVANDVVGVEALGKTTNEARAKVEGLVGVARLTDNTANGAGSKTENIARLTLDNVANDVVGVQALGKAANEARAQVEGLVGLLRVADNTANGARAETENGARLLALQDIANSVGKVKAVSEAADSARTEVEGLVRLVGVANNGTDSARAETENAAGLLALQDVADSVGKVKAVSEAADSAGTEVEGLVRLVRVANNRANSARAKVEGVTGLTLDVKAKTVDGVGDGVEERRDGAGHQVTLDDVEVADGLVEAERVDKVGDDLTLGLDANVDVVDNVLDLVNNAALDLSTNLDAVKDVLDVVDSVANNAALGDVKATNSVEDTVDGATDATANKAVDEVTSLNTDLDAVNSVLDVADSSREGVVDDAALHVQVVDVCLDTDVLEELSDALGGITGNVALDREVEARDDGEAAGDCVDVGNVVDGGKKSLTLGGHGHGGRREGESDESVLHLEKECVGINESGKVGKRE